MLPYDPFRKDVRQVIATLATPPSDDGKAVTAFLLSIFEQEEMTPKMLLENLKVLSDTALFVRKALEAKWNVTPKIQRSR